MIRGQTPVDLQLNGLWGQQSLFPAGTRSLRRVLLPCALESDFPAAAISRLAEHESWRKEVHRPATHTHKWWAQRLGTVFRAILTAAVTSDAKAAGTAYASRPDLEGLVVYDPFAGSGTTLVEAAKLRATIVGRDINPVATLVQRQALQPWNEERLRAAYRSVEQACRKQIDALHVSAAGDAVLYYFWVAVASCPRCDDQVDLFSSYVFARHAYPRRYPAAQATCPSCRCVVGVDLSTDDRIRCRKGHESPLDGPVRGQYMTCSCGHRTRVVDALAGSPPGYRMYAKLVVRPDGTKAYEAVDEFDTRLFEQAERLLAQGSGSLVQPVGNLDDGINTRQAIRWGYRRWEQFFNARQLYCLGLLGAAIRDLDAGAAEREALTTLFSGTLEFNNLFCSYKGEGTGAVRHMFSHHILKPERVPLEAHPWGTPYSSGAFSTLFESRLLRAHAYKNNPHDIVLEGDRPVRRFSLSYPLSGRVVQRWEDIGPGATAQVVCGDSASTDLPDESVDLVVTDPPFMDNVHYSELADFFHAWLTGIVPFAGYPDSAVSTRDPQEVQSASAEAFGAAIEAVWKECCRVLRPEGLLAFTFHQARIAGWTALMLALRNAGFQATAIQPIKAEMSTSVTKSGASEPSNLDSIIVCRKLGIGTPFAASPSDATGKALRHLDALRRAGIAFGAGDVASVVRGSVLSLLTSPDCQLHLRDLVEVSERTLAQMAPERDPSKDIRSHR